MAGNNSVRGLETITFTDNMSFDGTERGGALTTNAELWLGSTIAPHVRKSTLISGDGSITFAFTNPTSTTGRLDLRASSSTPLSFPTDSGTATPAANALSIVGLSGSKTSGSGSTVTVKSPPYSNQGAGTTVTVNSGSFATAAITLNTPASAADGDLIEFVATNGVLVVDCTGTQVIHVGSSATSAGGTATSTATGDALCLRYQASTDDWWATSSMGVWVLA